MLTPKVGDTVFVELTITCINGPLFCYDSRGDQYTGYCPLSFIKGIKPREPKVGDKVTWVSRSNQYEAAKHPYTLLYIHNTDERKFGVVAYCGDMPRSIWFEDLRICVD